MWLIEFSKIKLFGFVLSCVELSEEFSINSIEAYMQNRRLGNVMAIDECQTVGMQWRYSANALMKRYETVSGLNRWSK